MPYSVYYIIYVILIVALLALAIYLRLTYSAGDVGEHAVARRLKRLPRDRYFIINDLMIEKRNGQTSQIDHVVVSPYGIFVIETKNISGYVYGSQSSQQWTRYWKGYKRGGYYGTDNMSFGNPVIQNEAHVRALSEQLKEYHPKFIPIVAFSPHATLKVNVKDVDVIYWKQIKSLIKSYNEEVMNVEKAKEIYEFLLSSNVKDKERRRGHAERAQRNLQNYINYKQNASFS